MKNIPVWPKMRWSLGKDESGLVLSGKTIHSGVHLGYAQAIDQVEIEHVVLPMWVVRRKSMRYIRQGIARYITSHLNATVGTPT